MLKRLCLFLLFSFTFAAVSDYNVVWTEVSDSISDSMPIGNGITGLNVWPLPSKSAVLFYISSVDAWDENANLLKLGLVEVTFSPNPFGFGGNFVNQTLDLSTGTFNLYIGGHSLSDYTLFVRVWVDTNSNTVTFSAQSRVSSVLFEATVSLNVWRVKEQPLFSGWRGWYCHDWTMYPDVILQNVSPPFDANTVVWYHRNDPHNVDFFNVSMHDQGLGSISDTVWNPLKGRTFGGAIIANGFKKVNSTAMTSTKQNNFSVKVYLHTSQTSTINDWLTQLHNLITTVNSFEDDRRLKVHQDQWTAFWARSFIEIHEPQGSNDTSAFIVSQQYAIWRYLQAIQGRGAFPVKFNGLIFVAENDIPIDYRQWGGANWWQNLRLPYYNMLNAGDLDLMKSLFDYYKNMLDMALKRTEIYFKHSGAFWPETQQIFGIYYPSDYGCSRSGFPVGIPQTRWNRYNFQGGLDLSLLILDHWTYGQDNVTFLNYLPIITSVIDFYANHWTATDQKGKIIFYPSQAIETWQCVTYPPVESDCVTNDLPDIAGLYSVLQKLLALPSEFSTPQQRTQWTTLLGKLPAVPSQESNGATYLVAGDKLPSGQGNVENPELYAVHPYRLYGVGKPDIDVAIESYKRRIHKCNVGWCQDLMNAAFLGLADEATSQVIERAKTAPAKGYRFPGFMPAFQDSQPSADHLSNMNTALSLMLLQPLDDKQNKIVLFPAWPCKQWDVTFKLHGPRSTTITGVLSNGRLRGLEVDPPERRQDIIFAGCV
eukprot:TRINITY_DN2122_c0_g1_i1.p1 TRINITY_DN2122_c0_g1~~TRINITY_DN2122_c0_g1_i1.p1  ORF type:complete len:765 (+),score=128.25 TRINITY_DN2122_c0_g1_i1:101-2395(+)